MLRRLNAIGAFSVLLAGPILAEEKVNNPEFTSWSKFAKGTSVTRTWTSVQPNGQTSVVTETTTLKEVGADMVVIEVEYISDVPGSTKFKTRPESKEILKLVALPAGVKKDDFTSKLLGIVEEGKELEKVKVRAGEFKCKWYKTKTEVRGWQIEAKSWVSDDVPGRIVKTEETKTAKDKQGYITVKELVEFTKP
jgi:uncharacterized protein YodC (DUF2158 family)